MSADIFEMKVDPPPRKTTAKNLKTMRKTPPVVVKKQMSMTSLLTGISLK
jgi:hypothetical protein